MYLLILYIVESLVLLTDHILTQSIKILELTRCRLYSYEYLFLDLKLYNGESWELLIRLWAKLEKDFRMKDGRFEISKIPDIYDCIKYDLQHNQKTLQYERASEPTNGTRRAILVTKPFVLLTCSVYLKYLQFVLIRFQIVVSFYF